MSMEVNRIYALYVFIFTFVLIDAAQGNTVNFSPDLSTCDNGGLSIYGHILWHILF